MGTITKEIFGQINGKVGNVVISKHRGTGVVKSTPAKRRRAKKVPKDQNLKLKLMSKFISKFLALVNIGFYKKKSKLTPANLAMMFNLDRAITGESPDFRIDYPKIVISEGYRETAWSGKFWYSGNGKFTLSWEIPESAKLKIIGKDMAKVLLYNSTDDEVYWPEEKAERMDRSFTTLLNGFSAGDTIHAWLFFVSPDGKEVSNSDYMGSVVLPAI